MMIKAYLLVSALAASSLCMPHLNGSEFCTTPKLSEEEKKEAREQMAATEAASLLEARQTITVQTYLHVIAKDNTVAGGYLSRETMLAQMDQLNNDFAGTGFGFSLADIDWTGSYSTLNLYFQDYLEGGYSTRPKNVDRGSDAFFLDGCYISKNVVPGGSSEIFPQGKIAAHEVGHWLFLYHTFDGGCVGEGDEVDDTPAEKPRIARNECPVGRDSCQGGGPDPIHNHMIYTTDSCRTEFTPGQISRMHTAWVTYRQGK
ncbi:metalloprotease 1 precursor [Metarhizium guizhouense ARSEF 977]|uniref:Metalloprotease 1 n=1 Tax=Metarhizium guizhouense (strain ARSEF 977) TaxID=1276136 RepID=A0A0B4GWT9_METGA|nr:metalloprotease 1 precursor [Metarhizium guizhouense ARSEF 977]